MTRDAKIMLYAKRYPEREKGGRGKRSDKLAGISASFGISVSRAKELLSNARKVDAFLPKIADEVIAGELLKKMEKAKGAREPGTKRGTTPSNDTRASPKTIADLGVTSQESSDFQKLADVPQAEFERFSPSPLAA
jgi:hypothetical protein